MESSSPDLISELGTCGNSIVIIFFEVFLTGGWLLLFNLMHIFRRVSPNVIDFSFLHFHDELNIIMLCVQYKGRIIMANIIYCLSTHNLWIFRAISLQKAKAVCTADFSNIFRHVCFSTRASRSDMAAAALGSKPEDKQNIVTEESWQSNNP